MYGEYIGPLEHLQGKKALLRTATHEHVVAQFDDQTVTKDPNEPGTLGTLLGYGWHAFPEAHFRVIEGKAP